MVEEAEKREEVDIFSEALKKVEEQIGHPLSDKEKEAIKQALNEIYVQGLLAGRTDSVQNYIEGYRTAVLDILAALWKH